MVNENKLTVLRKRADFESLFQSGRRVYVDSWLVVNFAPNEFTHMRYGWTIPKFVGNAVIRNRFKRWIREFVRSQETLQENLDLNFVLRRKDKGFYKNLDHEKLDKDLQTGMQKISKSLRASS